MGRRGPRTAPRGPKSSRFVGVKKRGSSTSVDMRCGRRWEVSGFATEELAGLAHDFFRLLQGVPRYISRNAEKLNFPQDRTFLIRFSEQNRMEKFRVVAEEKNWGDGKKKDFMELVQTALVQIKSGNTVRAGDSNEDAEAAGAQQVAADFVQNSNDDTNHIRISGGEENKAWDMERVFLINEPSSNKYPCSRESESAIHPRIVELDLLLDAETEKNRVLEIENKRLHAENERLRQHFAVRVEGGQHGQNTTDAPVDGQAQSGDSAGTNTGLPFRYELTLKENSPCDLTRLAELHEVEADASQPIRGEATDGMRILSHEVHEPESQHSKGEVLQNCSFELKNARLEAGLDNYEGAITIAMDWNGSKMSDTGTIKTQGNARELGFEVVDNEIADTSFIDIPFIDCTEWPIIDFTKWPIIDIPSGYENILNLQDAGTADSEANTAFEKYHPDRQF